MSVTVLKAGLQTTVQSRSRRGLRHLGVPASGAADPLSLALANRLVGNGWDTPALEATLLGPTLRFEQPCAFAIVGALARSTLNGAEIKPHETIVAEAGDELVTGAAEKGARFYIAVAGGFEADELLGSSSTYLMASFGGYQGRALETGDELKYTPTTAPGLQTPAEYRPSMTTSWALRACESFETGQLTREGRQQLFDSNWIVARRSDRMGLQLEGPLLEVSSAGRMPSAAVFPGTLQCPESGSPFVLGVDAATVGGYPRVAQVARADRHLLGQLRPGDHVRFLMRNADAAVEELRAKLDYWRAWIPDIGSVI
jgi:allophanate hydrolase